MVTSLLVARVKDLRKVRLQRCTANEESIDVRLRDEIIAVGRRDAATILDAHLVGNAIPTLRTKEFANGCMCILGLLWCGDLASANSPDGLVRNHNLVPILD